MEKTGLVLEGGAMRGLFTAGVLDVLMENNMTVDGMIGVSAGAAFGCNFKSHQPGRVLRYNLNYCKDPRYCSVRSLIRTGDLFGTEFCYETIPEKLDPFDYSTFEHSKMEFYVVGTDVSNACPVYHRYEQGEDTILEWIRASSAMPMAANPVTIGDVTLLDGGVSDPIPLSYFLSQGYRKNVVVLTQPRPYKKKADRVPAAAGRRIKKYPEIVKALETQAERYNQLREELFAREKEGDLLLIYPSKGLPIHRITHNPDKIMNTYNEGRTEAIKRLDELSHFLLSA